MARVDLPDGNDDELIRLYGLSPAMGAAAGNFSAVYGDSSLPTRVREVARIRIASVNQCPVCLDTRTSDPNGLTEDEYLGVDGRRNLSASPRRKRSRPSSPSASPPTTSTWTTTSGRVRRCSPTPSCSSWACAAPAGWGWDGSPRSSTPGSAAGSSS
ncbi:MAG: carboxymuconolactone decarboxylase family protein [Desulfomicrobium escambiense]|nr:carboxymuconolactone decarboxylase family protein [Desulfomicrobium escambiense]